VAFIDEQGKWIGPGPDPRQAGVTTTMPATFDPKKMPSLLPAAGYTPNDWTNLIKGNSGYMNWQLSAAERADSAAANRKAALRALSIRYGGLPSGFKDVYGDLSEQDIATARGNPLSEFARLQKSYGDSVEMQKRQLAARGALQSGDLGYSMGQLDYGHSSDLYDLGQQFDDAAQGTINSYGEALSGLSREQIDAIRQAAQDVYDMGYRLGVPNVATGELGSTPDWVSAARPGNLQGGQVVGNGEIKMANSASELDQSGGWGVQWQGPGYYTPVKYVDPATGRGTTVWVFRSDLNAPASSGGAAPPAATENPIVTAPTTAPSVRPGLETTVVGPTRYGGGIGQA
jgi:hypothetical protein